MILSKSKFSIITGILYVLVASTLSLLVIYDVSEGFGFSPIYALVFFGVCAVLGLVLYKLLSYTSSIDFFKSFTDKGKYISVVVFTFMMVAAVCFRCLTYMWSGLGGNAYFEIAKVTGETVPHYVHPADELYVQLLHSVFFLFGNRIYVAAITNCLLQLIAVCLGFIAFRRLLGNIPALSFGLFWTVSGFSVHEALTLNSRTIVFLFIMIAVFALSIALPAREGKIVSYIVSGILIAFCIYVDITGLVLIPFLFGMLFFVKGNESSSFSLRAFKTLLTFISSVFGFVLIIIADGFISSSNPIHVVKAIVSRYLPASDFTLGFSYMSTYTEMIIMAVIVSVGVFVSFFTDEDSKAVLLFSTFIILLINNFELTYLENDGRCLLFTFCTLFAGLSFRELFPAVFTGDLFKASAEIDNDISYPDEGYVPAGLSPDELIMPEDDLATEPEVPSPAADIPAAPVPLETVSAAENKMAEVPASAPAPSDNASAEKIPSAPAPSAGSYDLGSFDAIRIPMPASAASAAVAANATAPSPATATAIAPPAAPTPAASAADSAHAAGSALLDKQQDSSVEKNKEGDGKKNDTSDKPKSGGYVYQKPQLKPEYRRMPGAWTREQAKKKEEEKKQAEEKKRAESRNKESDAGINDQKAKTAGAVNEAPADASSKPAQRVDENGVVLLDNPIPHPERKTEHKAMEFDSDVSSSDMDYDIKVSDDDDFDV